MEEQRGEITKWLKHAAERGYTTEKIKDVLAANGYDEEKIASVLAIRDELKKKRKLKVKKDKLGEKDVEKKKLKPEEIPEEIREVYDLISKTKQEVQKVVIGQEEVIDAFMCALLCDGHVLLEGVPGIAKTLLVKALAEASGCTSKRIQFTVDLLPSDIIGITTYTPEKGFETIKGPIFANFIVADEINRSPPKTQSALIEAMQEKQVTIAKETYPLPLPFFVMANNNPLESSGVYDLPEAQVDRFLFKVLMNYPKSKEEMKIMEENVTLKKFEDFDINPILSDEKIIEMQKITKNIYMDEKVKDYIVRIIQKTRKRDFKDGQYIEWGGSPRASIGIYIASKAWALMHGRNYVVPQDIKDTAHFVLRHRIILNYKARAEGITSDKIIDEILASVSI
jgi:MoxR-like ATPase